MFSSALLHFLHFLGIVVWVGGMFFAYVCLRPAAVAVLEPPQRLRLWQGVFSRFFPWVWVAIVLILASGLSLLMAMGGMANIPHFVHLMLGLGLVMMAIFAHVFFSPYQALKRGVAGENWPAAGAALSQIRLLVGVNLGLGILNIAVATVGEGLL